MTNNCWFALDVEVEPPAREAVEYGLMEAGALGTETVDDRDEMLTVTAYFSSIPDRECIRSELFEALRIYELPSSSIRDMSLREVPNRDWLEEWKQSWQPIEIGRFIIAPPWAEVSRTGEQIVIRIEPGMAFGTGTHETTRMCLFAIQKYFGGKSFLDVGTGTGILAIAAAKINANARVEACDIDAQAIGVALENARLNGVADQISFSVGSVEDASASADLVCANLTAEVIRTILPALIGATCGRLVLAGILNEQLDSVRARLFECGVTGELDVMHDGEWATIVV
jgi:ribosomal protein L11 methyltransferase